MVHQSLKCWWKQSRQRCISPGPTESIKALNRRVHWRDRGEVFQQDSRHVDVLLQEIGLETANAVQTPATDDTSSDTSKPLGPEQLSRYRSQVVRCVFLCQDRAGITSTANALCQRVANRTQQSLVRLKRLVRYLKGEWQGGQVFSYDKMITDVITCSDSG